MATEIGEAGGMLVPPDVAPFIDEVCRRGGCIIRYEPVRFTPGAHLICPAAMQVKSIEWLGGDVDQDGEGQNS